MLFFEEKINGEPKYIAENGEDGENGINFEPCIERKKKFTVITNCKRLCRNRFEKCKFIFNYHADEVDEFCPKQIKHFTFNDIDRKFPLNNTFIDSKCTSPIYMRIE